MSARNEMPSVPDGAYPEREYLTLAAGTEFVGEFEDRRSRHIAQLAHVESEREAQEFIDKVRARHRDARHNVPVWVLASGLERCSDDGEPSHTAGVPVLGVLKGACIADVCCVVTRYFGGTLLGPGGLKRAYTAAAREAVEAAAREGGLERWGLGVRVTCSVPYAVYGRLEHLVDSCGGRIVDSIFGEDVQISSVYPQGEEGRFVDALVELLAGEAPVVVGEPQFRKL